MNHLFLKIIDLIFPPRNTDLLVRKLSSTDIHTLYAYQTINSIHVLSAYTNPNIRALIHETKFHNNKKASVLLGELITRYFLEHNTSTALCIPIPLSRQRMRVRGYNQVSEILQTLTIPMVWDVLIRLRDTRPQTELARTERLTNMRGAFGVIHGEKITGKHILLVDDVMTTGATLTAAKTALLLHAPASVTCLALAH